MVANIKLSFSMLLPSILDHSKEIVSSSHVQAIPAVEKYSEWTNSLVGLKAKISREITNESTSITNQIGQCSMTDTARGVFTTMLANTQKQWQSSKQFVDDQMLKLTRGLSQPRGISLVDIDLSVVINSRYSSDHLLCY